MQGTASVVLAGLIAAVKLLGGALADHKFLFLGAGEVSNCYLMVLKTNGLKLKLKKTASGVN